MQIYIKHIMCPSSPDTHITRNISQASLCMVLAWVRHFIFMMLLCFRNHDPSPAPRISASLSRQTQHDQQSCFSEDVDPSSFTVNHSVQSLEAARVMEDTSPWYGMRCSVQPSLFKPRIRKDWTRIHYCWHWQWPWLHLHEPQVEAEGDATIKHPLNFENISIIESIVNYLILRRIIIRGTSVTTSSAFDRVWHQGLWHVNKSSATKRVESKSSKRSTKNCKTLPAHRSFKN